MATSEGKGARAKSSDGTFPKLLDDEGATVRRGSKVRLKKTRIRSHFRRLADYAIEDIDRFREHVRDGCVQRLRTLEERAGRLPLLAQEFLAGGETSELDTISRLADQLSIVALYRAVEVNAGRMLAHEFGRAAAREASNICRLKRFLRTRKGIELASLPHYRAIDELRLLNNAIKHVDLVTKELAENYHRWREGEELSELGTAYERLRGKVPSFIFHLAQRMKLRYR